MTLIKLRNPHYRQTLRKIQALAKKPLKNPTEEEFRQLCLKKGFRAIKGGAPDTSVYDQKGNFKALVEIKKSRDQKLRETQKLFRRFCKMYNIPFLRWAKGEDLPPELYR